MSPIRLDIAIRLKNWTTMIEQYKRRGYIRKPEEIQQANKIIEELVKLSVQIAPSNAKETP